MELRNI